jgi:cysteine-rich repeat protein
VLEPKKPVCGNRAPETGEQCDDGNLLNGDGCDSTCQIELPDPVEVMPEPGPEPEQHSTAPIQSSCNTGNIPLETMQINGQYYISWKPIDKAVSYIVYRADKSVSSLNAMNVVSRTVSTKFEYPFDPNSEMDQYAWYAVEAICENNDQKQIGNITAVKVGPEHTILFILGLLVAGVMTARVVKN